MNFRTHFSRMKCAGMKDFNPLHMQIYFEYTLYFSYTFDFLDYCDKVPNNFSMLIDGRYENTAFLKREIGAAFRFTPRYFFSNTVVRKKC